MATGQANQLTKQVGEFLVAAELGRRQMLAAVLSGNTPMFDLVATDARGKSVPVQVKAIRGGTWQFNVGQFAEITFRGDRQIVGARKPCPRNLVCVLVVVSAVYGADAFFVLPMRALQKAIVDGHRAYLARHGGVRPKNPRSLHTAVAVEQVERHRDRWGLLRSSRRKRR
jgi:hypothetical protein